jgi:serine/threonine protein kinase
MRMAELTTWTNGSLVGPYVLLESIGEGGMGEVWKARDTRLDRVVAVKRLKNDHGDRFEQEARTIAALNHPHICQIFDIGSDYLVLEYIDGQALRGPRSPAESVDLAIQIASALEEAHACGILHRDLKPANIMVTAKGAAKLLDFGLAKLITPAAPDGTTTTEGTILGTVAYMAPEQAEGKRLDQRSDIFSFGVVLYELLSGRRAFQADSSISTLAAILYKQPAPLDGPAPLPDIVNRCLAKLPAERFQTMVEVRKALEKSQQQTARPAFDSIELDRLESLLSRSVGPIAKTLVGKAAARHSSFEALCQELAQHIPGGGAFRFYAGAWPAFGGGAAPSERARIATHGISAWRIAVGRVTVNAIRRANAERRANCARCLLGADGVDGGGKGRAEREHDGSVEGRARRPHTG